MPVEMTQCKLYSMNGHGKPCEVSEITDITEDLSKANRDMDEPILRSLNTSKSVTFSSTMSKNDVRRFRRAFRLTWYWRLYYRIRWKIKRFFHKEKRK